MLRVSCNNCNAVFPDWAIERFGDRLTCGNCSVVNYVEIFPSILKEPEKGKRGERVLGEEAACFRHPGHAAVVACDNCGIYLCALCDLEIDGQHLCPDCLNNGQEKIKTLRDKTTLHDDIALSLAVLPIIMSFMMIITAPATIIYSLVCWNKMNTPYKRNRWRFVAAIIIASIEAMVFIGIIISTIARG